MSAAVKEGEPHPACSPHIVRTFSYAAVNPKTLQTLESLLKIPKTFLAKASCCGGASSMAAKFIAAVLSIPCHRRTKNHAGKPANV